MITKSTFVNGISKIKEKTSKLVKNLEKNVLFLTFNWDILVKTICIESC
jgi:hypothetical protein